jgi:hypothetical protein
MSNTIHAATSVKVPHRQRFTILSPNPGKRSAERFYFLFFLASLPFQMWVTSNLSYSEPNDIPLVSQGMLMGCIAWFGPLLFRAVEDRGRPFYEVYGFKFGCFLFVWAVIGGYLGTDPWYEVLHGHFAFNTEWNPNGVPFFMLPMTIAVFGAYSTILGSLFRMVWWLYERIRIAAIPNFVIKAILFVPLAALMPLLETLGYTSEHYCFDNDVGQWFLNVFIYGSWHFAGLVFYTQFEEKPESPREPWLSYVVKGFATVGLLMTLMQLVTDVIAPHYTEVTRGVRHLNDWSPDNCLGPKPERSLL